MPEIGHQWQDAEMVAWLLIHSPVVGPAIWTPTAAQLRQRAQGVTIPDLTPAVSADGDHVSRMADLVVAAAKHEPVVLVAHSGAGPLLPLIAHRLVRQHVAVVASIFVDARLPYPGQSTLDVLPPPEVEQLREMAVEGWLPPWPSWWPPGQLETMLPDEHLRNLVVDTCPRLPLSMFTEVLPRVSEHELGACSYVRLSSGYDAFADQAEQAGWPVHRLEDHHLAILTSPAEIADTLQNLADTEEDAQMQSPRNGTSR